MDGAHSINLYKQQDTAPLLHQEGASGTRSRYCIIDPRGWRNEVRMYACAHSVLASKMPWLDDPLLQHPLFQHCVPTVHHAYSLASSGAAGKAASEPPRRFCTTRQLPSHHRLGTSSVQHTIALLCHAVTAESAARANPALLLHVLAYTLTD